MTNWLKLTDEQRKATIDQAEQKSGISAKAIEKDWWVTLTLKALFGSRYASYMVFKGGTSLSKCWKLIERFSEDIDIALAPEVFGMEYRDSPSKSRVDRLRRAGCSFTTNELKAELSRQFEALEVPANMVLIEAAPISDKFPDTDPQTLFVKYPSLYSPNRYLADEVKIEVSVRSLRVPYASASVNSLLYEINPNQAYAEEEFFVEAVDPRKTFLEKIFLLHEEFKKPDTAKIKTERMSRHLYDLGKIMTTSFGGLALEDHDLYDNLIKHRQWYSRISWVDYSTLARKTISFIPPEEIVQLFNQDYEQMQEQMIYGEALSFDDLIQQLKLLQKELRNTDN
ncbi:MAG: nucleotidyl transferase AbiEii/AbiGii toxin family protein [Chitinophagaceae bacterium]|nr:nucleotidyl transferase AbiEii/AbiGii toxin family protein [Chitinophagaceae bacterium]